MGVGCGLACETKLCTGQRASLASHTLEIEGCGLQDAQRTGVRLHYALDVGQHVLGGQLDLIQLMTEALKLRVVLRHPLSLPRLLCHILDGGGKDIN